MAKLLHGLDQTLYEHELDKKALKSLKSTPGIEFVGKKILEYGYERLYKINYTGSHIKAKDDLFSGLYRILHECCDVLSVEKVPDLYVEWNYSINGFTVGHENPIIVVTTGSVDLLSEAEMRYLLGHELGHIKSGHCLYHMMAQILPIIGGVIGTVTLGIGELISNGLQLALLNWQRTSEFTSDRAGLLACQDPMAVIGAFMKISGVPHRYYGKVSIDSFIQQSRDFEMLDSDGWDKFIKFVSAIDMTHPWTVMRSSEILKWVENGEYNKILNMY